MYLISSIDKLYVCKRELIRVNGDWCVFDPLCNLAADIRVVPFRVFLFSLLFLSSARSAVQS